MGYGKKLRYEKVMEVSMGEYRLFISIRMEGRELAVGLPLSNCRNRNAWIKERGSSSYLGVPNAKSLLRNALGKSRFRELAGSSDVRGLL
jgi:hypothetical protein